MIGDRDVNSLCDNVNSLYTASYLSRKRPVIHGQTCPEDATFRWNNLATKDPKMLWQSINWRGSFDNPFNSCDRLSGHQFCQHYQQVLTVNSAVTCEPNNFRHMPVLDSDISQAEADEQLQKLKYCKVAGIYGILKHLTN